MPIRRALCTALSVLVIAGCAAGRNDFILLNEGTKVVPLRADVPVVLTVGDLDRPYQEIGVIRVSGLSRVGYDDLNAKLRAQAREAGADAVIYVRYGTENVMSIVPFFVAFPYDVLMAEGLAVRSKQR